MSATIKKLDRYQIVRLLGSGGMGEVYLAQDPTVDRFVAIKLLKESLNTDEFRERFLREVRAAAKLEHPNVVKIFGAAKFRGRPFIVMEYISGSSLAQVIAQAEPMSLERKLEILLELCDGLAWAHAAGIVHRDIKPGNVMLDGRGHVKIVDFGIAKSDAWEATSQQISMGTPCYMSPEQLRQQTVDHRSDMFSAAVVGYELLTYRKLFEGDAVQQVARVLSGQIPSMTGPTGSVPGTLERVIRRALSTRPGDRFKDMAAMQSALAAVRAQIAQPSPSPDPYGHTIIVDPVDETQARVWLRRAGVGAGAVCALALGGWLVFSKASSQAVQSVSTPVPVTTTGPPSTVLRQLPGRNAQSGKLRAKSDAADTQVRSGATDGRADGADRGTNSADVETDTTNGKAGIGDNAVTGNAPPGSNHDGTGTAPGDSPGVVPPSPPSLPTSISRVPTAAEAAAIRATLIAYQAAFEKGIAASVKEIRPTLSQDELAAIDRGFLDAQSYHLEISINPNQGIALVSQSKAQVTCRITRRIIPRQGDPRETVALASIVLDKTDDRWLITAISEHATKR